MARRRTRRRVPSQTTVERPRWLGAVIEIALPPTPPDVAMERAIEELKAIQKAGPTYTLADLVHRPYAHSLPKGKTLHAIEHRVDQGRGLFAPHCSKVFVTRLRGGPREVVSRIHFPAIDRNNSDVLWRRIGDALVDDGSDHPVIRKRNDLLAALIQSGKHLPDPPLRPGPHSRAGARDAEIAQRFDLTLRHMSEPQEITITEEIVLLSDAIRVRVLDDLRRPVAGVRVVLVRRHDHRRFYGRTDTHGEVSFEKLPSGEYGVRAYDSDDTLIGARFARPGTHRFMAPTYDPVPGSSPWAHYIEMHRHARRARRRPSENAAVEWLTRFFAEFLVSEATRHAVIEKLRKRSSTGNARFRAMYRTPRGLAEALTEAFFGVRPGVVRQSVRRLRRRMHLA